VSTTPDLITVKEAAAMLAVSEKWWRRRIDDGTCPVPIMKFGKHIRHNKAMTVRNCGWWGPTRT